MDISGFGPGVVELAIIVVTCLLCLVVLAGGGAGIWFMRKGK